MVYAVTSLAAAQAAAVDLAEWVRGHWIIENCLHWVRDVSYDEDRSQVRTGAGTRAMASLRILAVSLLLSRGATNIAQVIRHHAWDPILTKRAFEPRPEWIEAELAYDIAGLRGHDQDAILKALSHDVRDPKDAVVVSLQQQHKDSAPTADG